MKILIIQEAGKHDKNKNFREALNLCRSLQRLNNIEAIVWGSNYSNFSTDFSELEKWSDVIFILENYHSSFIPVEQISKSKKIKVFWSIDSHCILSEHIQLCKLLNINLLLNSSEQYIPHFESLVDEAVWFPNAYPDDLIFPMNLKKTVDIGFCGNILNRQNFINFLDKYNIKKDIFVIGDEMVKEINTYKIHFNRNISDDINYRTFETTGCKTLLLTNYTPNLEKLFEIGKEVIVYEDLNDLDEKVSYLLNNESERIKIETAGYERSRKDHTYDQRARFLIKLLSDI